MLRGGEIGYFRAGGDVSSERGEVYVAGYEWNDQNRQGCRWDRSGIGILVDKRMRSRKLRGSREGLMWVE